MTGDLNTSSRANDTRPVPEKRGRMLLVFTEECHVDLQQNCSLSFELTDNRIIIFGQLPKLALLIGSHILDMTTVIYFAYHLCFW